MLTLATVAAQPELLYQDVRLPDGTLLCYRPLLPEDVSALTEFLAALSPLTRQRWTLDSYDQVMAESLCAAIGRYDKLRLVAIDPHEQAARLVALFEFSFGIPDGDIERFATYGIKLDEAKDCRFGPCVRDGYQRRGVASALMGPTITTARRFGKGRIILWGGVLADNAPALAFYQRQEFGEVGRFYNSDGKACVDMMRTVEATEGSTIMGSIQVGNAPCSWGTLEFEGLAQQPITYQQMLDELVATGYTGTELGDWGFMPTDPAELVLALTTRSLSLTGAYVGVRLEEPDSYQAGEVAVLRTARLLATVAERTGQSIRPFLVLAADNGSNSLRTRQAGRITPQMGLSAEQWRIFAGAANQIAAAVQEQSGLRTVFHPHCAGWVETPDEITRLLELTDPALLGIVFDTGHYAYGTGGCATIGAALARFADRIWYVHFKDCHPGVLATAHQQGWDYFEAVRNGVFCELGQGCVDFPAVLAWLHERDYAGFVTVEQDVLPGMGTPKESAARNRAFLHSIGLEESAA